MAKQLSLPDGRNLDYLESGAPDGFPLFFIHGTPGSYVPPVGYPKICLQKGVRLITVNRSGYGGSTRDKGRRIVNIVADLTALKQHLGIDKCVVGGWSGGGPHALACAARLPGCLAALSIAGVGPHDLFLAEGLDWIAGQGQDNVDEYHASLKGEDALREFTSSMRDELLKVDADTLIEPLKSLLPEVDKKALLESPDLGQNTVDSFQEGLKFSADGYIDDSLSFIEPWGFDLAEIGVPVFLWQGGLDMMVPYSHGQFLARKIPEKFLVAHMLDDQGHISVFVDNSEKMLDELLSVRPA